MRRLSVFLLLFLICSSSVVVGQDDKWTLVEPTLDEYLDGLEPITEAFTEAYFGPNDAWGVLEAELDWRYGYAIDYQMLERAYNILNKGYATFYYTPLLDLPAWNMQLVSSWLKANPVDFSQYETFIFDPYVLYIEDDFDFDGDGENDLFLTVDRTTFADRWLAFADQEAPGGYRFERLPVAYQEVNHTAYDTEYRNGGWENEDGFRIDDVNDDGKDEIIIGHSVPYPGSDYTGRFNSVDVLGWTETGFDRIAAEYQEVEGKQELRRISPGASYTGKPDRPRPWEFKNTDEDTAQELRVIDALNDNFGCLFTEQKLYDWDGQYYMLAETESGFADTFYCAVRQAEEAVIEHADYVTAIPYYELAVERFAQHPFPTEDDMQLIAYAQERLVLAYVMVGRPDDARTLLQNMGKQPDDTIAAQLLKIPADDFTPLNVCRLTFDFLEANFTPDGGRYHRYHDLGFIGQITPWFDLLMEIDNPVNPAKVGCDYGRVLEQQLSNLSVLQPLIPQIEALDIGVADEFHADLNSDGLDEWLVWFDTDIAPALFMTQQDEKHYRVQFTSTSQNTAVPQPSSLITLSIQKLPNASSTLVALETYTQDADTNLSIGRYCFVDDTEFSSMGRLLIWRIVEGEFSFLQGLPLCEQRSLTELFPKPGIINAWQQVDVKVASRNTIHYLPAIYQWNEAKNRYVGSHTPSQEEVEQIEDLSSTLYQLYSTTTTAFAEADFQDVLMLTDEIDDFILPADDLNYELTETYYAIRYYRAMAFEALDQPDEALMEYVSIYESMPDSAWGMLAALHFEATND